MKEFKMAKTTRAKSVEIRATRIVLVDESNKERIVMQLDKGQPSIDLIGQTGKTQVRLSIIAVHTNSAELLLASPDGMTVGRFSVAGDPTKEGTATILFGGGHKRIVASTNLPGSKPSLVLTDEAGSTIAHIPPVVAKSATTPKRKTPKTIAEKAKKKS